MSGRISVVVGGQFGSEAKGTISAHLALPEFNHRQVVAVRVAGPNAGHTVWGPDKNGNPMEFKLRQIPTPAISNPNSVVLIADGSEIDLEVLDAETKLLREHGYPLRGLHISPHATVIQDKHKRREAKLVGRIGSTGKGIGAARAARLMRTAKRYGDVVAYPKITGSSEFLGMHLKLRSHIIIEGTQGYGLGLHTRYYPQVTSSDCRAIDFLAMSGVSPWSEHVKQLDVWVTLRTRPIRVAGNSGPLANETSWDTLGLPEERTTVTNKVRRVGGWDSLLALNAIRANGGPSDNVHVALTMLDQQFPETTGITSYHELSTKARKAIVKTERQLETPVLLIGTSPTTLIDRR